MMVSRSFKFLSAMTCGTPQPRAEDHETLANHVVTRLNDTRIAKSQAPDNRAELQGWVPEGGLRGRGAHGLAWCACSPSAGNGDILISTASDSPKNESPEKCNAQNFSGGAGGGPRTFHPKGTKCCAHGQNEGLPIRAGDGEQG